VSEQHYCRVKVEHGTLETVVNCFIGAREDDDAAIAKARRMTENLRTLPMAYECFTVIERRPAE
jgi:hypothetical protein